MNGSLILLIVLGVIGIATLVVGYLAQLALFNPQKLYDYIKNQNERLPSWWPGRDMNLRLIERPGYLGFARAETILGFLVELAAFVLLIFLFFTVNAP